MKKKEIFAITPNEEKLSTEENFPQSEEKIVLQTLFPGSNNVVIMKLTFPDPIAVAPTVTIENGTLIIEPEFYHTISYGIVYGKVLCNEMEETALLMPKVDASGKVVLERTKHHEDTHTNSMLLIYPRNLMGKG